MKNILFLMLLLSIPVFSQTAGESGLSFLKLGFGARNIALGDNGTTFSNDVTAVFYNPANLAGNTSPEVLFMHNQWIQDVRSEVAGVRFQLFGLPMAIGVNSTTISDIEVRTKPGPAEATFDANYFYSTLATGFYVSERVKLGFGLKYLYEGIFVDEATGFGFDAGASYLLDDNITVSAAVRNIGSMNELRNEATKLPTEGRIGALYRFELPSSYFDFGLAAELQKYFATDDIHLNFGGEVIYNKTFALRLGYQSMYEAKNLTGGLGIYWGSLAFDYALTPFSYDLGTAHSFSIRLSF